MRFFILFLLAFFIIEKEGICETIFEENQKDGKLVFVNPILDLQKIEGFSNLNINGIDIYKTGVEYRKNGFTWFGKVKEDDFSTVVLTYENGYMFGSINYLDKHYRIEPVDKNIYVISEEYNLNEQNFPRIKTVLKENEKLNLNFAKGLSEDGKYIDVLILYTKKAKNLWKDALNAYIQNLVDLTNAALKNSNINTRINIVGTVLYDNPSSNESTNTVLARMFLRDSSDIEKLREKYRADMVFLLREKDLNSSSIKCGVTNGIFKMEGLFSDWQDRIGEVIDFYRKTPIGVIEINKIYEGIKKNGNYCSELYFVHHLGHSLGCDHNRENVSCGSGQAFHYSFAYRGKQKFRTVMSPEVPRVLYFSNPDVALNGEPIGIPSNSEQEPANNKKTIEYTSHIISNFEVAQRYPEVSLDKNELSFKIVQKTSNSVKTLHIYNYGERDLKVDVVSDAEILDVKNNCSTVKSHNRCSINVSLKTLPSESKGLFLTLKTNDPTKREIKIPVSVERLSSQTPQIYIKQVKLDFGNVLLNRKKTLNLTVKNTGNAQLEIGSVSFEKNIFALEHNCSILLPSESCTVKVVFLPEKEGRFEDRLVIISNDPEKPQIFVNVSGTGEKERKPDIEVISDNIDFNDVVVGSSKSVSLPVKNTGDNDLEISLEENTVLSDFYIKNRCKPVLKPGEGCQIQINFIPSTVGEKVSYFYIKTNVKDKEKIKIKLNGNGVLPVRRLLSVEPLKLSFETELKKTQMKNITVKNTGNAPVNISKITVNGDGFSVDENSCKSIKAGEMCKLNVVFSPAKVGYYSANVHIFSNSEDGDISVELNGTATNTEKIKVGKIYLNIENSVFIKKPEIKDIPVEDGKYIQKPVQYTLEKTDMNIKEYIFIDSDKRNMYMRVFYKDGSYKDIPVSNGDIFLLEDGGELDSDKEKNGEILRYFGIIEKHSTNNDTETSDNDSETTDNDTMLDNDNISNPVPSNTSGGSGGCSFSPNTGNSNLLLFLLFISAFILRLRKNI